MTDITFDLTDVSDQKEILRQVCYRLDRQFPNQEVNLSMAVALKAAKDAIAAAAASLVALVAPETVAAIAAIGEAL